jgi:signal transduction histidine kinase
MNVWRSVAVAAGVALAGALATLALGELIHMPPHEVGQLALYLLPAIAVTVAAVALAAPLLARAPIRQRLLAVAVLATVVALANLIALARLMVVSAHDAVQVGVLLAYSTAAGVGAALALARHSSAGLERLTGTARRLAAGDLGARAGRLRADPELDALAATLDEMAARLGASLERQRAVEEQRRDLITAVSHDLRTPLAGLRATVEAIDDGVVEDPPSLRRYVAEMRGAVDSLVGLVDDLFELVQLDAGAIEAESERARLEDVVRSAVAACDSQAAEKGLALETRTGDAGGALCSPRLTRVVQNLVQNAIRHTPADGSVRVEARRCSDGLELVVEDTGEGIAPDAVRRVFEPFWRADAARSDDGSGLGLALAKRIVEALGGQIRVESEPARGSRFAVVIPEP